MRRFRFVLLILAALVRLTTAAAAADESTSDAPPSLEYRPQRQVIPEPRAPIPASPVTIFREVVGGFGIGNGSFDRPVDVAVDTDGNFYVLDAGNNRVQRYDSFSNYLTSWGAYGTRPGEFINPKAILVDTTRTGGFHYIFVLDAGNHRVQIFQFERQTGKIVFFESWGGLGSRDGDFKDPRDIVLDGEGFIWVLDSGNERVQKFLFEPERVSGRKVSFVSGWGKIFGSRGGKFEDLVSIGWSRERLGYIFLLGAGCLVQKFQLGGTLVDSWPAIAPESGRCSPARIEIDNKNFYVNVLDAENGLYSRFSSEGRFLFALRGATQSFSRPLGLAVNPDRDEVLVADTENNIIQKFTLR